MELRINEVNDILQKEIVWCLDHPDPELSEDHQVGFMNGLRQAQLLIKMAERAMNMLVGEHKNPTYRKQRMSDIICEECGHSIEIHHHDCCNNWDKDNSGIWDKPCNCKSTPEFIVTRHQLKQMTAENDALQAKLDIAMEIIEHAANYVGGDYDDVGDLERMDGTEKILSEGLAEIERIGE
jgi:hypothetical protein